MRKLIFIGIAIGLLLLITQVTTSQEEKIVPGDKIKIQVIDHPDASLEETKVPNNGYVIMPYLKRVKVAGKTRDELKALIEEKLSKFYKNPEVIITSIRVGATSAGSVLLFGQVARPGEFTIGRAMDLLSLLGRAGDMTEKAYQQRIEIRRTTGKVEVVSITDAMGKASIMIYPGDRIFIPIRPMIFISGDVKSPGAYDILEPIDLDAALSQAGGAKQTANINKIAVSRRGKAQPDMVDLEAARRTGKIPYVNPGDSVRVPISRVTKKLSVEGKVKNPGVYIIFRPIPITEAIAMAGGRTEAAAEKIRILRAGGAPVEVDLAKLLATAKLSDFPVIHPGDTVYVPKKKQYQYYVLGKVNTAGLVRSDKPLQVHEAIAMAGGFAKFAKENDVVVYGPKTPGREVEVTSLIKDQKPTGVMNDGDTVFVP
jgi:protein involved in polysaccharide export with SLBB domain